MNADAKTLIIIEKKDGKEVRVNCPEETMSLVMALSKGDLGQAFVFRDVDGSFLMIHTNEFVTIRFIPQEPVTNAS